MTNTPLEKAIENSEPSKTIKKYMYVANHRRTLLVEYSFWLFAILSLLNVLAGIYVLSKFNIFVDEQTEEAKQTFLSIAQVYDGISIATSIVFIVCAIIFLFWLYRASSNTHALNNTEKKMEFTPGWCIGSYFIPFFNFFWPYKSMKELWRLNVQDKDKQNTSKILVWWLTYLLCNFIAGAVSRISNHETVVNAIGFDNLIVLDMASDIFGIISALIIVKIIKKINAQQININSNL